MSWSVSWGCVKAVYPGVHPGVCPRSVFRQCVLGCVLGVCLQGVSLGSSFAFQNPSLFYVVGRGVITHLLSIMKAACKCTGTLGAKGLFSLAPSDNTLLCLQSCKHLPPGRWV